MNRKNFCPMSVTSNANYHTLSDFINHFFSRFKPISVPWGSKRYMHRKYNKPNLWDLIAATGLVILLKLDSNHRIFTPCDLEMLKMTLKNNRAPLLYYIKFCELFQIHLDKFENQQRTSSILCRACSSFQSHGWIQTGVTVRKRSIRV